MLQPGFFMTKALIENKQQKTRSLYIKCSNARPGPILFERDALQKIADKYKVDLHVVGSRGRREGRNVESSLPVGKGTGTRSDIDVRVDPQSVINSGGHLADDLKNIGINPNLVEVLMKHGDIREPAIVIKPRQ